MAGPHLRRSQNQTGAGLLPDEQPEGDEEQQPDSDVEPTPEEALENQIGEDLASNIRHAPVKVARHYSPFNDSIVEAIFLQTLEAVLSEPQKLPEDYGILEEEWEDEDYPEIESIRPGTSGKELLIILPRVHWFPRAVQWVQALDLMTRCLHEMEDEAASSSEDTEDEEDSD